MNYLSDFQVWAPYAGGRKAHPYETLNDLFGRGEVYPRPNIMDNCSNLLIGIAQFRIDQV